jgi:hypothetical protein
MSLRSPSCEEDTVRFVCYVGVVLLFAVPPRQDSRDRYTSHGESVITRAQLLGLFCRHAAQALSVRTARRHRPVQCRAAAVDHRKTSQWHGTAAVAAVSGQNLDAS